MTRVIVVTLLMLALAATPGSTRAQRADSLDQPLLTANLCGPGDGGETYFTIAATGDTFPHENIQAVGEAQGYEVLFDYVRPFLQAADLAYTNFDGAMLEGASYTAYPNFNYNPALATALKNAGIGLVSTANNHILDRGPEGIDATLRVLEANTILQHGTVASTATERPAYLPITLSRDGATVKIGFISASWGTNGMPDPYSQVNLLYQSSEYGQQGGVLQGILDAVAQADRETDLVIVAAHWGTEYQFYPDQTQIDAAQRLAEAGADVILGAQSHTLQPVDIIDTGGRKTLVIYSLANFLASQGAFQEQYFSASSVIFYVGLARSADGHVRVTGYRYLPTIHVDNDTRPAPIAAGAEPVTISHIRTIMRDLDGARQLPPDQPAGRVEVCPALLLSEAPQTPIPGDFAQAYVTLGSGSTPRPITDGIAVYGLPLGPVRNELAGDCTTQAPVLYTERQRLELHAGESWPFRVAGTQIGVAAFEDRYPGTPVERRTDLAAVDAFADPRFRSFYERYGGLSIFGYPISGALSEDDGMSGAPTTVQYFERARFELAPAAPVGADLSAQVRLGLLGRELLDRGGIAALCGGEMVSSDTGVAQVVQSLTPTPELHAVGSGVTPATLLAQISSERDWLLPVLAVAALLTAIVALAGFALADWRSYRQRGTRHGYRWRRSAYERFAKGDTAPRPAQGAAFRRTYGDEADDTAPRPAQGAAFRRTYGDEAGGTEPPIQGATLHQTYGADPQPQEPPRPAPSNDDELLRQLLGE